MRKRTNPITGEEGIETDDGTFLVRGCQGYREARKAWLKEQDYFDEVANYKALCWFLGVLLALSWFADYSNRQERPWCYPSRMEAEQVRSTWEP